MRIAEALDLENACIGRRYRRGADEKCKKQCDTHRPHVTPYDTIPPYMVRILCLNGGSSSLKYAAYRAESADAEPSCVAQGQAEAGADSADALECVLREISGALETDVDVVGHRIVFGGDRNVQPAVADQRVLDELEQFVEIEPLHMRAELDLVYAAQKRLPGVPNVLCFDTAFHRRSPAIAKRLPLPREIDPLIQRYGFHGLSYEYIASELGERSGRTIVAHLGSGASLCAMRDRRPVDTTMGFSTLGGMMMGTRPGDLDPGIVLRLLSSGYDLEKLTDLLYERCGLRGVSGISGDMRTLAAAARGGESAAREAVELFVYQLIKAMGSLVAVLGGLDTLIFTGGIGEHDPAVRASAAGAFSHLGVQIDESANARNDRVISGPPSDVRVLVIPTNENLMIARHSSTALLEKFPQAT